MIPRSLPSLLALAWVARSQQFQLSSCNKTASATSTPAWWTTLGKAEQDPCAIASEMRTRCGIPPANAHTYIPQDFFQLPPEAGCLCFESVYDMYGACRACQLGSLQDALNANIGLPASGSTNTSLVDLTPKWVSSSQFENTPFSIAGALQLSGAAALPNAPSPTSGGVSGGNGAEPSTNSSKPTTPPIVASTPSPQKSSSSHTGAIVGGVIGGLVLLAVLGAIAFVYFRRKEQARLPPSAEFTKYIQQPAYEHKIENAQLLATTGDSPVDVTAGEEESPEAPPRFTPGRYVGPVFEKEGYVVDPNVPPYAQPSTNVPHGSTSH